MKIKQDENVGIWPTARATASVASVGAYDVASLTGFEQRVAALAAIGLPRPEIGGKIHRNGSAVKYI